MNKLEDVKWDDVQGLVLSGYPKLDFAAYIPWRFVEPLSKGKAWLADLIPRLMRAEKLENSVLQAVPGQPVIPTNLNALKAYLDEEENKDEVDVRVINVALTWSGLDKLGAPSGQFSAEFVEGMAPNRGPNSPTARRCNLLGDIGDNSPKYWQWGGWDSNGNIDGMLLVYARTDTSLNKQIDCEKKRMRLTGGVQPLSSNNGKGTLIPKGRIFVDHKEHFGFVDGISQPIIAGTSEANRLSPPEKTISVVKPGEFVIGYLNERGASSGEIKEKMTDFVHNGTYLVFRQLEQNVTAFRKAVAETAKRVRGNSSLDSKNWVAERMMGRKKTGEPLIPPSTEKSGPLQQSGATRWEKLLKLLTWKAEQEKLRNRNNFFLYYFEDRFGFWCPLGAHTRRANPRDSLGTDPHAALRLSKMHRIIRRGRPYGKILPQIPKAKNGQDQKAQRGLLFICLNADIAGQFELVQHSWINNGRFNGLYSETDPIMNYPGEDRLLTIQRSPTNECADNDGLDQFVTVRGGAYFFLPGIKAMESLTE